MQVTGAFLWLWICWSHLPHVSESALSTPLLSKHQLPPALSKHHPQPATTRSHIELLSWAVEVRYDPRRHSQRRLDEVADGIASFIGLVNHGQIGSLRGLYQLDHKLHSEHFSVNILVTPGSVDPGGQSNNLHLPKHWRLKEVNGTEWTSQSEWVRGQLEAHGDVQWFTQLHAFRRKTRSLKFKDPAFPQQWHLVNTKYTGQDLNISRVWERNVTGKGVVTAVVDDGLEWTNPDLSPNYFADASYDLNNNDRDPMPSDNDSKNHHGTRCAGEIAAAANSVCGVGVAYESQIAGLKVLDGPMTDSLEGVAFTKAKDLIDVYSCSWGPDDDGKTVDGPHYIALRALREAVDYGRQGYGNIFVVASGNGGMVGDNCNFDGYANSIYTVTIGAVDELGNMPYYAEECASMLAVTFSSGSGRLRSIVTTDWQKVGGTGCTPGHTGTSAAAPLAAGLIALMLQVRPCLTWRDVQHVIVMAAVKVDIDVAHWTLNKAGFHHSHKHGFGLMDAWRLVNAAKTWRPVPWMTLYSTEELNEQERIPDRTMKLVLKYTVTKDMLEGYDLFTLEYVHAIVTLDHAQRGTLEIRLQCPSGTASVLAATRDVDTSAEGFDRWTFSTVRCWGETPEGEWVLTVQDKGGDGHSSRGVFKTWQLKLYGSAMSPADVASRRRGVQKATSGTKLYDNFSLPCPPPPLRNKPVSVISEKNLKILVLVSAFCMVMAVYESLEYVFCYDDEKKKHKDDMAKLARERQAESETGSEASGSTPVNQTEADSNHEDATENARLLGAEAMIPMENLSVNGEVSIRNSVTDATPKTHDSSAARLPQPDQATKAGFADKLLHVVSQFFHRGSHHYEVLSDSDKSPLIDDVSDDVIFDVADGSVVMNGVGRSEAGGDMSLRHGGSSSCNNGGSATGHRPPIIHPYQDGPNMAAIMTNSHSDPITTGNYITAHDMTFVVPNGTAITNTNSSMKPVSEK